MKIEELKKHKKILIIGYGVEGRAAEQFLKKNCPDSEIGIADKKDGDDYLNKQNNYDLAIKSPGVRPELVKIPYTTSTNIFFSNYRGKTIGVTGTKGKSTTATLIYEMLKKQGFDAYLAGNIGEPMINVLDKLSDHPASPNRGESWTVLELSSFQLQDIKNSPNIAVMLMTSSEHLDYHKDEYGYIDAKRNIFRFQKESDLAVINRDYPASNESDILTEGKVFYVSRERETGSSCYVQGEKIWINRGGQAEEIINIKDILLLGKHNLENVVASSMTAILAGVKKEAISEVLKTFSGLEHRLEFSGEKYGIKFYNDTLATIPEAAIEAVEAFSGEVETLIAGGHDRGLDYSELGRYLVKSSVTNLILFMPSGKRIWEEVVKAGGENKIKKFEASSMREAVLIASEETESGKICLLSPAAASFGTFKDYKDRGEQFKKEVEALV